VTLYREDPLKAVDWEGNPRRSSDSGAGTSGANTYFVYMGYYWKGVQLPLPAYHLPLPAFRLPLPASRLPLTAYHLPLTAYRLPLTAFRLPLSAYRLPLTAFRLPLPAYHLPLSAYRFPLTAYRLPLCRRHQRGGRLLHRHVLPGSCGRPRVEP
jgi:hypothetical protein